MDYDSSSRRVEKRNRPPVSCEPCRTRKLKCSRTSPCESCVRRDKAASCIYTSNAVRNNSNLNRAGGASTGRSRPVKPRELKDRLSSLETLVSSFLAQSSAPATAAVPLQAPPQDASHDAEGSIAMTTEQLSRTTFSAEDHKRGTVLVPTPDNRDARVEDGATTAISTEAVLESVNFIDPSHWLSILDDIKEVREHLVGQEASVADANSMPGTLDNTPARTTPSGSSDPSILLASSQAHGSASLDEILTRLPAKSVCDMLLSWYFNSQFMVLGVVHPARFQTEYEQFWKSPSTTSPLWIALLFSVLSITVCFRRVSGIYAAESQASYATAIPEISALHKSTLQCLVLGGYATATAHALEALILHMQSTFTSHALSSAASAASLANESACKNNTALVEAWFLMGTIIRLAFRMGYHREEQESPPSSSIVDQTRNQNRRVRKMSVFDAEMRRRVWLNVVQVDALLSFQIGLPSMIVSEACNTRLPLNLEYADLDPAMTSLPAPRPLEHYTPSLYTIVKAGIMAVFKKITIHAMALHASKSRDGNADDEYDRKTAELDAEMRAVYNDPARFPLLLRARDVAASSIMDSACLISQRATIEILHLKGLVVLHRRYITYLPPSSVPVETRRRHRNFRRTCVAAALDILARQADLHAACSPGGRLFHDRWMPICAVPVSDYLLAAMVVCLDLSVRMRDGRGHGSAQGLDGTAERVPSDEKEREDDDGGDDLLTAREYHALQTSHRIYAAASSASPDARVAAQALGLMLRKVAERDAAALSGTDEPGFDHDSAVAGMTSSTTTTTSSIAASDLARLEQLPLIPTAAWDYTPPSTTTPSSSHTGLHSESLDLFCDPSQLSYAEPMSMMIDGSESIDWGLLDQFLQNIDPSVQDQPMDLA